MERVTITLDEELLAALDRVISVRGYQSRSEAIRDLARSGIQQATAESGGSGNCIAALVYVCDHATRNLPKRLTDSFHDNHDLSVTATRVHLDHDSYFEVAILRGRGRDVQHFAEHVIAERGVRHGQLVSIPVDVESEKHSHGSEPGHQHLHAHVREAG